MPSSKDLVATETVAEGKLILEIEVIGYNVEGIQAAADDYCDGDVAFVVTEELMRADVGLTLVSIPSEMSMNHEFEVHAMNGRIVGARISPEPAQAGDSPVPDRVVPDAR
jgi:hypothetical protein